MTANFLAFGAQYFRSPTPLPESWESDIRHIKEIGFNTIKIWAQWRTNNPRENIYDFSDIKALMNIAQENGLKVIINIILDVAPVWFYKKYPESVMRMANGSLLLPQPTEYRQAGGAPGPCYHHDGANSVKREFVEKIAKEFCDHPALLLWDLWNEPELTCGIAREADEATMVCYCEASEEKFKQWLQKKYGTIEVLNQTWHRNYNDFEEVELPRNPRTFRDMIDWRRFFSDTLADDLQLRVEAVKKYDTVHPVMVHTVPPPYFNMINACTDDYKMAKLCDLFGNSIASQPFPAVLNMSSANGKQVMNAEIHAVAGETFNRSGMASYTDFKRHIYTPFSKGIKGFLFWQYRPEILGRESPAWGLTDLEGKDTDYVTYAKRINSTLQKRKEISAVCQPPKRKIAIIKDSDNEIFCWCATTSIEKYSKTLSGSFQMFYDLNYNVDILTVDQILENGLDSYQLVYYPLPYYMRDETAVLLEQFVKNGGTLISEAFFGGYSDKRGLHSLVLPGFGFERVFGARECQAAAASKFLAAYGKSWTEELTDLNIAELMDENGASAAGYYFYEAFEPQEHAEVLARYRDGKPAIIHNTYGKGHAIIIGSLFGHGYEATGNKNNLALLQRMIDLASIEREIFTDIDGVRADLLLAPGGLMIAVNNHSDYEGGVSVSFHCERKIASCRFAEDDTELPFIQKGNRATISYPAKPLDIDLIICEYIE